MKENLLKEEFLLLVKNFETKNNVKINIGGCEEDEYLSNLGHCLDFESIKPEKEKPLKQIYKYLDTEIYELQTGEFIDWTSPVERKLQERLKGLKENKYV